MKKKYKIWLAVLLLIIVLLSGLAMYRLTHPVKEKEQIKVNILDSISEYGYVIDDRDSELYKDTYNELKEVLSSDDIDYKKYSELVAKMFIIDLYSIDSKINKYDVGGSEYYHTAKKDMYETKVKDSLYDLVEDDSYGDRNQELPLVKSIDVDNIEEGTYKLGEEKIDCYIIELSWTYEKDLGYDKKGYVTVVKDDIKQSVVSFKTNLEEDE